MPKDKPTVQVSVRVDPSDLEELERIGSELKPIPASRNAMIGVAIREYVEKHGGNKKPPR
jgi:hypothetical protein